MEQAGYKRILLNAGFRDLPLFNKGLHYQMDEEEAVVIVSDLGGRVEEKVDNCSQTHSGLPPSPPPPWSLVGSYTWT